MDHFTSGEECDIAILKAASMLGVLHTGAWGSMHLPKVRMIYADIVLCESNLTCCIYHYYYTTTGRFCGSFWVIHNGTIVNVSSTALSRNGLSMITQEWLDEDENLIMVSYICHCLA